MASTSEPYGAGKIILPKHYQIQPYVPEPILQNVNLPEFPMVKISEQERTIGLKMDQEEQFIRIILIDAVINIPFTLIRVVGNISDKLKDEFGEGPVTETIDLTELPSVNTCRKMSYDTFERIVPFLERVREHTGPPPFEGILDGYNYPHVLDFASKFQFVQLKEYVVAWLNDVWIPNLPYHWQIDNYIGQVDYILYNYEKYDLGYMLKHKLLETQKNFVIYKLIQPDFKRALVYFHWDLKTRGKQRLGGVRPLTPVYVSAALNQFLTDVADTIDKKVQTFKQWNTIFLSECVFSLALDYRGTLIDHPHRLVAKTIIQKICPTSSRIKDLL